MKKILSLLVLGICAVGLNSCNKTDTPTAYYGEDHGDLVYTIDGLQDVILEQTDSAYLPIKVNRSSGRFEDLTLSVANTPKGIYVSYIPQTGQPSFNTVMNIVAIRAQAGDYPISVTGYSQTSGSRSFNMMLHIKPYSNPALALQGKFTETGPCSVSGNISNTVYIEPVKDQGYKVMMTGFWAGGLTYNVMAIVDAKTGVLTIPAQTINKVEFTGNGTYTDSSASINYTVQGTTFKDACQVTLTRQ